MRSFLLIFAYSSLLSSCNNYKTFELKYKTDSNYQGVIETRIKELAKNPHSFNGKHIIVEGFYQHAFEMSALTNNKSRMVTKKSIWVEFNDSADLKDTATGKLLLGSIEEFNNMWNKRIRIKGVFDSNNKGHLGNYSGEIHEVCSIEIVSNE